MLNIGEFSKITGLTIKAIHLYHEKGLLIPSAIDEGTGYRYFDAKNVEQARVIVCLKEMEFSLEQIAQIVAKFGDEKDIIHFLLSKKSEIEAGIRHLKSVTVSLDHIIKKEKEALAMLTRDEFEIEERKQESLLVATIRWKGKYRDTGTYFGKLARAVGRHIGGKPMNLYHELEFKENDADIESCFPIRKEIDSKSCTVKSLEGGTFLTLIHKGPYESIGRSYEKILSYLNSKGYKAKLPVREVYLKGPGMIFKGNPKNYLTEIQIQIAVPMST